MSASQNLISPRPPAILFGITAVCGLVLKQHAQSGHGVGCQLNGSGWKWYFDSVPTVPGVQPLHEFMLHVQSGDKVPNLNKHGEVDAGVAEGMKTQAGLRRRGRTRNSSSHLARDLQRHVLHLF